MAKVIKVIGEPIELVLEKAKKQGWTHYCGYESQVCNLGEYTDDGLSSQGFINDGYLITYSPDGEVRRMYKLFKGLPVKTRVTINLELISEADDCPSVADLTELIKNGWHGALHDAIEVENPKHFENTEIGKISVTVTPEES